jgi:EF hand/EF-hand domain pair
MKQQIMAMIGSIALAGFAAAQTPSDDIARGNMPMHMDVNEMDSNHDGMISKAEFAAYGEKIWKTISHGKATVPVNTAAVDFATGNMAMKADEMDTDHDGSITHKEFMDYGAKAFDTVKNPSGMLTLADTTKYFSTGNMKP